MSNAQLSWKETLPGVWRTQIGVPETLTPLGVVHAQPRAEAIKKLPAAGFPLDPKGIRHRKTGSRLIVRLPLLPDERIYGFGLQFIKVDHRGRTRYLRVNSDPREDTGESHAPVPFYISSRGYGVLVNTARIPTIYVASSVRRDSNLTPVLRSRPDPDWQATPDSDDVEIVLNSEGVEILVFAGPTPLNAVQRYNLFCGGGALPPRWGLGFWHRVHYLHTAEQVIAEALELRQRQFPCDVIGLEPGWHSNSYPTSAEWDRDRFPDPARFVDEMTKNNFHINLWENPYLSPKARIYEKMALLSGSHTVWGGLVPDYTLPEARELLLQQHKQDHLDLGVAGYKIDEVDGSELTGASWMFPAHATFPSGHDGEQMRQVYGLLLQGMTADLFRKIDRRTYGLVRASNAGGVSLPYVLYSDLYDHRQFVRALCNSSFSGLLWTPEIRDATTGEDWVRRMQVVCFSPLAMLNAWASSSMPWSFPEVEPIIRKFLELRMRLMPYFYSAFARYHFEGIPPFRAMALETGGPPSPAPADGLSSDADLTVNAYGLKDDEEIGDQYMAGDSILVAPLFAGETGRKVFLPPGVWYEFESGRRHEGNATLELKNVPLEALPLFVRAGALIPLMPAAAHTPAAGEAVPLEIRHYGPAPGFFQLYDDDGETFAYERGQYQWRELAVTLDADGKRQGSFTPANAGFPTSYGPAKFVFLGENETP